MGLFDFLKKNSKNGSNVNKTQIKEWEKDLSVYQTVQREIKPLEDVFVGCAVLLKYRHPVDEEIAILQKLIKTYEEARQKCYKMGRDYAEYFRINWDECRQTKENGPSYITPYQQQLEYIKFHYKELKEKEKQYQQQSKGLEKRLVAYLKMNDSVLQSDIYKSFGPLVKDDIRELLYQMEKTGKVERKKSGRSYIVMLK